MRACCGLGQAWYGLRRGVQSPAQHKIVYISIRLFLEFDPMPYKDMREFLDVLQKDGQLKDCDVPIKAAHGDNELQALMRLLCQNDGCL